ncbi:MAG TPA: nucleotidyltransferase family protein [Methanocorpusculum sp.]|nr:nucleotidyltransferase family protein [Methanocorpusculum sp.]HJJ91723.1 nucleotidyltransferase family protein [Methanocorpusculum sp.]
MSAYVSIREEVLEKLQNHLPELQERFGIETIGIFGSVARGDDSESSDVDVLYAFEEGRGDLFEYAHATEYLENLFGRNIDFVSIRWMNPRLRKYVEPEMILFGKEAEAVA